MKGAGSMNITQFDGAEPFLEKAESFLLKNEAVNNLPLGILYSNIELPDMDNKDTFFALVENHEEIILVTVKTAHNLVLYGEGPRLTEAINLAVSYLIQENINIPGIIGPTHIATEFAETWKKQNNSSILVSMKQRIYKLDEVNEIKQNPGRLRVATMDDVELVTSWVYDFSVDALEPISRHQAPSLAEKGINEASIYLWEDKKPVSMAKKTRPTKNGVVINLVYTPLEFRKQGYATSCVASLSQKLLDSGYKFCSLYTDLANPTSNHIYMKIGYSPIQDSIVYDFR
jgi:predicted GNAT family acetyltransferase